ncbi:MAG: hypothetical protein KDI46_02730 [Alphaproteobacteria bacterium]|nr:hypothetical protein [Alphaproteobacteria bacterium]
MFTRTLNEVGLSGRSDSDLQAVFDSERAALSNEATTDAWCLDRASQAMASNPLDLLCQSEDDVVLGL